MDETLAGLLREAMRLEQATSGRALGDLAQRRGLALTHTQINHILAGTYHSKPKRSTIDAIATLARVKPEVAYRAAGVPMAGKPFADELPPDVDLLKPHHRKAVIGVVRAFLSDVKAEESSDGAPTTQAGNAGATVTKIPTPPTMEDIESGRAAAHRTRRHRRDGEGGRQS
ncbi:MAG: hypothetical protein HOV78_20360 [Hamadaea sp.]|nr:hypothetical protein [Hamadaea sp.]